jgi:hypothetical protein
MNKVNSPAYAPLAEMFKALVGERIVVILPGETRLDKAFRCERLHSLDDF